MSLLIPICVSAVFAFVGYWRGPSFLFAPFVLLTAALTAIYLV